MDEHVVERLVERHRVGGEAADVADPAAPVSIAQLRCGLRALEVPVGEHADRLALGEHRQVTDAWLLGLAVAHGLRFVTFDARLPLRVVRGATAGHVVVL